MKKIVVLSLIFGCLCFFLGGIYIITTIERATSKQSFLIMLHQVEILRENLLLHIKKVQSDLNLRNTRYARDPDTVIQNVIDLEEITAQCFKCHHSENVKKKLDNLNGDILRYRYSINRILTIRANFERLSKEEDKTFQIAEQLLAEVNEMVHLTSTRLAERTQSALRDISHTKLTVYILVALTPFFAGGLSFLFVKESTKPVKVLLEATRRLKSGDLDHRITGLRDEFGEVAKSFNEMAVSLKEQMLQMQRAEQMAIIGELAAGLAHEIKNPLAGIKVSVEVLAEELNISEEDRRIALQAVDKIKQIEKLIKSLLNFARPPEPKLTTVNINKILEQILSFSLKHPSLSSRNRKEIVISKEFEDPLPEILADPMQLEHAFLNLFFNAIEAMPEGGTLGVKTGYDEKGNSIGIEISDTGIGIDQEKIEKIFLPFFTTKGGGTGLGLSITRRLVEQNGGNIHVESSSGKGTVFHISLGVSREDKDRRA